MLKINSTNNYTQPTFQSNFRVVTHGGNRLYQNTTTFFRNDLNWQDFMNLLAAKYKDVDKVNVFNMACSDGSEPWSLAVALMEKFGDKSQKFFPIVASDLDDVIIKRAKKEPCNISENDLLSMNHCTKDNYSKYFDAVRATDLSFPLAVRPKPILDEKVDFKIATIQDEIKNIPPENSVVLCRNCWFYIPSSDRYMIAEELSKRLAPSSLVVIGNLENGFGHEMLLKRFGFEETMVDNVYSKI